MSIPSDKLLFVFDLANNHQGNADHARRIIREVHEVARDFKFHFGFKFQYRNLDTFIHPDFKSRADIKYVKRFSETRLDKDQFKALKDQVANLGFISLCTPFDEASVDLIEEHGFDIIKVASCSFTDWPLLERIVKSGKPVIASVAGASLEDIDKVVSFLAHRGRDFAIMHCVAAYPTADQHLQLNQISLLQSRYPNVRVGYSTHENPDATDPIKMAIAKGATIFERHVGVATENIRLNAYSATPSQIGRWLRSAQEAVEMCGGVGRRSDFSREEASSLRDLRRGVFAGRNIEAGSQIAFGDVFLAIPTAEGQMTANDLSKYRKFRVRSPIKVNEPVLFSAVETVDTREKVYGIVQRVKALLAESGVAPPGEADLEISHHYGIDRFDEFGVTMLTVVNREYCKKLIMLLPGQKHPEQYHNIKEETFHILHGEVLMNIDGTETAKRRGDVVVVESGMKHAFSSKTGAVIEEISSTHHKEDCHYTDPAINDNKNRKTFLTYWMA